MQIQHSLLSKEFPGALEFRTSLFNFSPLKFSIAKTAIVAAALLGTACSVFIAKETLYLESAQDHATQEEVRQQLGKPHLVATTKDGDPIWVYQVYYEDPGPNNQWGTAGTWCDEYVLTFDKEGVLRRWTHKSEGHGGELSPTYCVKDGFKPPS